MDTLEGVFLGILIALGVLMILLIAAMIGILFTMLP